MTMPSDGYRATHVGWVVLRPHHEARPAVGQEPLRGVRRRALLMEEALREIEESPGTPDEVADMRRCQDGRVLLQPRLRRVEATPYTSTPDGEYVHIPCLILTERYDEALRYVYREKWLLQESTDTVNWDYIGSRLQMELEAYQGKGYWRSASRVPDGGMQEELWGVEDDCGLFDRVK